MAVADHSGQAWLQGFNDVGQMVFNMTADELMEIKVGCSAPINIPSLPRCMHVINETRQDRDEEKFNKVLEHAIGSQFNFTCRAKQETFNVRLNFRLSDD